MTLRLLWGSGLVALVLVAAPASAFVRNTTAPQGSSAPGPELFWCTRQPSFVMNEKGSKNAGAEASLAAVRRSFEAWTTPDCTDLTFADDGTTSRTDVGFDSGASDNINLVVWREVDCEQVVPHTDTCLLSGSCGNKYGCWDHASNIIAVTTTSFDNTTGEILDADIELNGARFVFTTVDSPPCASPPPPGTVDCVATDIENTVTHEAGHFIGLAHSPDPSATMFASEALGETTKRVLSSDDVAGVCAIYPKGTPVPEACSQSGRGGGSGGGGGSQSGCGCSTGPDGALLGGALAVAPLLARRRRRAVPVPAAG